MVVLHQVHRELSHIAELLLADTIYDSFLAGRSIRMIKKELESQGVLTAKGGTAWSEAAIRNILKNEKYCGDVLMQKTYTQRRCRGYAGPGCS